MPLDAINKASAREKTIRHGYPRHAAPSRGPRSSPGPWPGWFGTTEAGRGPLASSRYARRRGGCILEDGREALFQSVDRTAEGLSGAGRLTPHVRAPPGRAGLRAPDGDYDDDVVVAEIDVGAAVFGRSRPRPVRRGRLDTGHDRLTDAVRTVGRQVSGRAEID